MRSFSILLIFSTKQLQNVQPTGLLAKISAVKVQDERVTTCKTSDKRKGSQVEAKRKRKLQATQYHTTEPKRSSKI